MDNMDDFQVGSSFSWGSDPELVFVWVDLAVVEDPDSDTVNFNPDLQP